MIPSEKHFKNYFKKNYGKNEDSYYLPSTISVFNCKKNKCLENNFWKETNIYFHI